MWVNVGGTFWEVPGEGKEVPPILPCRASLASFFPPRISFSPMCVRSKTAQFSRISRAVCLSDQTPHAISYRHCQSSVRDRYRILLGICGTFPWVLIIATFPEKKKSLIFFASSRSIIFLRLLFFSNNHLFPNTLCF